MTALVRWLLSVIIAVAAILFAVANRQGAEIIWSPLHDPLELPLFVLVLGAALTGFMLGGFMVWLNGAAARQEKRRQRRQIRALEKELEETKQEAVAPRPAVRMEQELLT